MNLEYAPAKACPAEAASEDRRPDVAPVERQIAAGPIGLPRGVGMVARRSQERAARLVGRVVGPQPPERLPRLVRFVKPVHGRHATRRQDGAAAGVNRRDVQPGYGLSRSADPPAGPRSAVSSQIVNGPSLTISTAISAPNSPSWVRIPSTSIAAATRSQRTFARAGVAASVNPGRRPRRVSANRVNWLTTRASPSTSSSERFVRPSSSRKMRSSQIRWASQSACASSSPRPTPRNTSRPGPMDPVTRSPTRTSARLTRCRSARTASA